MRKVLALALTAAAVSGAALASPASAATSDSTVASLVIGAGGLGIDVSVANVTLSAEGLGSILPSAAVSGSLGTTTVTDTRGNSTGWTASVAATDFTSGDDTIAITNATLTPGAVSGVALPTTCGIGGLVTFPSSVSLATTAKQLGKCAHLVPNTVIGTNTASWSNTMSLTVPATAVAGTYTSTVTQSVQ